MFIAKPEAERAGFRFWKPLVWDKRTIGMGYHYRARYEFVLFFEKGKRRLNDLGIADVISVPRIHGGYPAEKPPEVSAEPGQPKFPAWRRGRRPVYGLRQRRGRRRKVGAQVPRERSQSGGRSTGGGTTARFRDGPCTRGVACVDPARPSRRRQLAPVTGGEYANLVASYLSRRFGSRGLKVYREVRIGKTIIGKDRCIDVFCLCEANNKAFAIDAGPGQRGNS